MLQLRLIKCVAKHFSQARRTKMETGWEMPVTTARRIRTHARRTMMAMVLGMLVRR